MQLQWEMGILGATGAHALHGLLFRGRAFSSCSVPAAPVMQTTGSRGVQDRQSVLNCSQHEVLLQEVSRETQSRDAVTDHLVSGNNKPA